MRVLLLLLFFSFLIFRLLQHKHWYEFMFNKFSSSWAYNFRISQTFHLINSDIHVYRKQECAKLCKNIQIFAKIMIYHIYFLKWFLSKKNFVLIKILGRTSVLVFSRQEYGINCSLKLLTCAIPKSEGFVEDNKFI